MCTTTFSSGTFYNYFWFFVLFTIIPYAELVLYGLGVRKYMLYRIGFNWILWESSAVSLKYPTLSLNHETCSSANLPRGIQRLERQYESSGCQVFIYRTNRCTNLRDDKGINGATHKGVGVHAPAPHYVTCLCMRLQCSPVSPSKGKQHS